ncbi:expressed unknown protein [Seminavis robusta]|uniref:Uncharacterized protein n=1 Tax=Seminavis robusta TaxID=568900 RepID=A0A9N8DT52_9STRA|nr:expressed unknown protein [Seminavis robusta]|eukprot:Sro336_g120370.1 n/a (1467) ;mRNA; f:44634-49127
MSSSIGLRDFIFGLQGGGGGDEETDKRKTDENNEETDGYEYDGEGGQGGYYYDEDEDESSDQPKVEALAEEREEEVQNSALLQLLAPADDSDEEDQVFDNDANETATSLLDALYKNQQSAIKTEADDDEDNAHVPTLFENPFLTSKVSKEDNQQKEFDAFKPRLMPGEHKALAYQINQAKKKRSAEWGNIQQNFKRRRFHFRDEPDIGNAVLHRARTVLRHKYKQKRLGAEEKKLTEEDQLQYEREEDPSSNHVNSDNQNAQARNLVDQFYERKQSIPDLGQGDPDKTQGNDDDLVNSSDEEQDNLLKRLSQSQGELQEKRDTQTTILDFNKERQLEALKKAKIPVSETLDGYWNKGIMAPKAKDLEFSFGRDVAPHAVSSPSNHRRRKIPTATTIQTGSKLQSRPVLLSKNYDGKRWSAHRSGSAFSEFPLDNAVSSRKSTFLHYRQLACMASRFIVASAGRMWRHSHEDRMLRLLWRSPIGNHRYRRLFLHMIQTEEYAKNFETFLLHRWKDAKSRAIVARRLGIRPLPTRAMRGVTEDATLVQLQARAERERLILQYADGKMDGPLPSLHKAQVPIVPPNVGYMYIAGTTPPSPMFPLDETNTLFGPSDRHLNFRHVSFDDATYKVTLSSLLMRLGRAQRERQFAELASKKDDRSHLQESDDENVKEQRYQTLERKICQLQDQLFVLLDRAPAVAAEKNTQRRLLLYYPGIEIQMVQFYRSLMGFCSFAASGIPQQLKANSNYDDNNDAQPNRPEATVLKMDEVALKLHDFLALHVTSPVLRLFPRIHVTFALTSIAKVLPTSVAEILARPLDDHRHRTPMDIFRLSLEYMEENDMIVEDHISAEWDGEDIENQINVGELEYLMNKAVIMMNECVRKNPVDSFLHEWRLAVLCASLLLCSGHRLGTEALPLPSSSYSKRSTGNDFDVSLKEDSTAISNPCPRQTLHQFENVKRNIKEALRLLTQLAIQQGQSSRAHLSISSFWEWKQVAALVLGRSCWETKRLEDVRRSHFYHAAQWALQNPSETGFCFLEDLSQPQSSCCDLRLKRLAVALEADPNGIGNWRALTQALGPLGYRRSSDVPSGCSPDTCKHCTLLREGFTWDHLSQQLSKVSGEWWGTDAVSWWYPHYLVTHMQVPEKCRDETKLKQLKNVLIIGLVDTEKLEDNPAALINLLPSLTLSTMQPPDLGWFWGRDNKDDDGNSPELPENENSKVHECLPQSFEETGQSGLGDTSNAGTATLDLEMEAVYLKLVITCHLFGISHRGAVESIVELARRSVQRNNKVNTSCGEWKCLLELRRVGLDVIKVVEYFAELVLVENKKPSKEKNKSLFKPRFTEVEREALKDQIERFGYGRWSTMSRECDALKSRDRYYIYDMYKWMCEHGEIEDVRQELPLNRRVANEKNVQQEGDEESVCSADADSQDDTLAEAIARIAREEGLQNDADYHVIVPNGTTFACYEDGFAEI